MANGNETRPVGAVVFQTGNPGRLAVPGAIAIFMTLVFGAPALMLVATTWRDLPDQPVLLPVLYLGSLFPLAVLFVLRRLMSRYALRVFDDGGVELVLPFKRRRFAAGALSGIRLQKVTMAVYQGGAAMRREHVHFIGADGSPAETMAVGAFSRSQWDAFFASLRERLPGLRWDGFPLA